VGFAAQEERPVIRPPTVVCIPSQMRNLPRSTYETKSQDSSIVSGYPVVPLDPGGARHCTQSQPPQGSTPTAKPTTRGVRTNSNDAAGAAKIQANLASPQREVEELSKGVEGLRSQLTRVEFNQLTKSHSSVSIDPASPKSFQRLDSAAGSFFVSLSDVVPFLDGYKVVLNVGNPLEVTYSGFTLDVKWGPRYDYSKFSALT